MTTHRILRLLVIAVCVSALTGTQAWGMVWETHKNCTEFGHINQFSLDRWEGDWLGSVACAPTATMNSFIYLQNHYPTVYGNSLVPGGAGQDVIKARELALQWMNTGVNGTTYYDWVWGKYNFLENYAPGKTIYHGQTTYAGWTGLKPRPGWVQPVLPNWNFLYNELTKCQDIEIGINWGYDIGHALTVCGFRWDDQLNSGLIWYMDPWVGNCTPQEIGVPIWLRPDGMMGFNYSGNNAWVDIVLAESVPEPSALLLLGPGFAGVIVMVRRRRA